MTERCEEPRRRVEAARAEVAAQFITSGVGIEVGAGSRPFRVPAGARLIYGDIRDRAALEAYFRGSDVSAGEHIDAQSFEGIADRSLDFVISAHVIEHLRDPVGSIVNAVRVLKPGGVHILVVPDMRFTFDRNRPETTCEHVLLDFRDRGESTCRAAYEEHLRFVHPYLTGETYSEAEIDHQATEAARKWREFDIHFHAWTRAGFEALLAVAANHAPFSIESIVSAENENIFVLRRRRPCEDPDSL